MERLKNIDKMPLFVNLLFLKQENVYSSLVDIGDVFAPPFWRYRFGAAFWRQPFWRTAVLAQDVLALRS